jgi:hypothetical protein
VPANDGSAQLPLVMGAAVAAAGAANATDYEECLACQ